MNGLNRRFLHLFYKNMVMYIDVSDIGVGHSPFPYLIDYHLEAALSKFFISTKELFKACLLRF